MGACHSDGFTNMLGVSCKCWHAAMWEHASLSGVGGIPTMYFGGGGSRTPVRRAERSGDYMLISFAYGIRQQL